MLENKTENDLLAINNPLYARSCYILINEHIQIYV